MQFGRFDDATRRQYDKLRGWRRRVVEVHRCHPLKKYVLKICSRCYRFCFPFFFIALAPLPPPFALLFFRCGLCWTRFFLCSSQCSSVQLAR